MKTYDFSLVDARADDAKPHLCALLYAVVVVVVFDHVCGAVKCVLRRDQMAADKDKPSVSTTDTVKHRAELGEETHLVHGGDDSVDSHVPHGPVHDRTVYDREASKRV